MTRVSCWENFDSALAERAVTSVSKTLNSSSFSSSSSSAMRLLFLEGDMGPAAPRESVCIEREREREREREMDKWI